MKKESASSASPAKTTYRVRNWREYNAALGQRGSLTLWFDDELGERWLNKNKTGKPGASLSLTVPLKSACRFGFFFGSLFDRPKVS